MLNDYGTRIIHMGTPEADAFFANTKRAMAITPAINRLTSTMQMKSEPYSAS